MVERKETNPKQASAVFRTLLMTPLRGLIGGALKRYEGALKYGSFNYMIEGVRASVYIGAIARHLAKWTWGEEHEMVRDHETGELLQGCHHLEGVIENATILLESATRGVMTDDRPPALPPGELERLFAYAEQTMKNLHRAFGHIKPRDYTIADTLAPAESPSADNAPPSPNEYTAAEAARIRAEMSGSSNARHYVDSSGVLWLKCKTCPALLPPDGQARICDTCMSANRVVERATNRIDQG